MSVWAARPTVLIWSHTSCESLKRLMQPATVWYISWGVTCALPTWSWSWMALRVHQSGMCHCWDCWGRLDVANRGWGTAWPGNSRWMMSTEKWLMVDHVNVSLTSLGTHAWPGFMSSARRHTCASMGVRIAQPTRRNPLSSAILAREERVGIQWQVATAS